MTNKDSPWTIVASKLDEAYHEFVSGQKAYRLGILFVHGMGEQERGDTITQMGDALTEWLRKWLANKPDTDFRIRQATLRGGGGTPLGAAHSVAGRAHVSVVLTETVDGERRTQEWLLAESWWADAFRPASFTELVAWAIAVGPWLIASQSAGLERRFRMADARTERDSRRKLIDTVVGWMLVLIAAVVAAVVTPLAVGLLVLSLIPIPVLSDVMRSLARSLSGSFGDLLVLVRSPVRFAAMAERVRDDIEWVDALSDKVMIVAHSQGSAVAWHAVRRTAQQPVRGRADVAMFFTFGQAFRKLKSLHRLHTRVGGPAQLRFAVLATSSTLLLLIASLQTIPVVAAFIGAEGDLGSVWSEAPVSIMVVAGSVVFLTVIQKRLGRLAENNDAKAEESILEDIAEVQSVFPGFRWIDLWASADPAPNGPLLSKPLDKVASFRIRNLASTVLDHAVYWSNVTEFVSAVAFHAASLVPSNPIGHEPVPERLRTASDVREGRVSMLASARVAVFSALLAVLFGLWGELPEIGNRVLGFIGSLPLLPDWFSGWHPVAGGAVAAALITAIAFATWWIVMWTWHAVIRTDEGAFFGRRDQAVWTRWAVAWLVMAAVVPTGAVAWLSMWRGDVGPFVPYLLIGGAGLAMVLTLLGGHDRRLGDP